MVATTSEMVSNENDVGNCLNNGTYELIAEVFYDAFLII